MVAVIEPHAQYRGGNKRSEKLPDDGFAPGVREYAEERTFENRYRPVGMERSIADAVCAVDKAYDPDVTSP